mmetsp:Transcript_13025/g.32529  ORF Transcript_13025/g.32529 Transcript_13025/m.32529 type:complete len:173 (-) Transcript_13025:1284-1802(-)
MGPLTQGPASAASLPFFCPPSFQNVVNRTSVYPQQFASSGGQGCFFPPTFPPSQAYCGSVDALVTVFKVQCHRLIRVNFVKSQCGNLYRNRTSSFLTDATPLDHRCKDRTIHILYMPEGRDNTIICCCWGLPTFAGARVSPCRIQLLVIKGCRLCMPHSAEGGVDTLNLLFT